MIEDKSIVTSSISRRDFLKLKSFLLIWFYFLNSMGINIFANDIKNVVSKNDYSILDRLLKLPFSHEIKEELILRVGLQKKYCYDSKGQLHSLDRFLKETVNFIVSKKDFNDFKLLSSIKDTQIDQTYLFNTTAKHNELESMKYLQKKLIGYKDNSILQDALTFAIRSQSLDTTIHLMQHKLKLDENTQEFLTGTLKNSEYDIFCKKLSGTKYQNLLPYQKNISKNLRRVAKKELRSTLGSDVYYKYEDELYSVVYNAIVDVYMKYYIDDYNVYINKEKIYVNVWKNDNLYSTSFMNELINSLQINGFDREITDYDSYYDISDDDTKSWVFKLKDSNKLITSLDDEGGISVDIYDMINIEVL
ncbi:MAG: hypothetical protein U9N59_12385 [Campylobacterota bacterium]|nr:hypothetical protein [Campylobacterota bacterium]